MNRKVIQKTFGKFFVIDLCPWMFRALYLNWEGLVLNTNM